MDYQTSSRSQKKPYYSSSNSQSSSSRHSTHSATDSASIRYYTALANSSTPYESPYAQDKDRQTQPPTNPALRASATRSTSVNPSYKASSPPVRDSLSTYSSSSGGSLYTSSPSRQQHRGTTSGSMSSSKGMSSVSHFFYLSSGSHPLSSPFTSSRVIFIPRDKAAFTPS